MTVVISFVVIVLVAALVGRTCARSRPGSRHRPVAVDVTDVRTSDGWGGASPVHHHGGHDGHGHDTGAGGD